MLDRLIEGKNQKNKVCFFFLKKIKHLKKDSVILFQTTNVIRLILKSSVHKKGVESDSTAEMLTINQIKAELPDGALCGEHGR